MSKDDKKSTGRDTEYVESFLLDELIAGTGRTKDLLARLASKEANLEEFEREWSQDLQRIPENSRYRRWMRCSVQAGIPLPYAPVEGSSEPTSGHMNTISPDQEQQLAKDFFDDTEALHSILAVAKRSNGKDLRWDDAETKEATRLVASIINQATRLQPLAEKMRSSLPTTPGGKDSKRSDLLATLVRSFSILKLTSGDGRSHTRRRKPEHGPGQGGRSLAIPDEDRSYRTHSSSRSHTSSRHASPLPSQVRWTAEQVPSVQTNAWGAPGQAPWSPVSSTDPPIDHMRRRPYPPNPTSPLSATSPTTSSQSGYFSSARPGLPRTHSPSTYSYNPSQSTTSPTFAPMSRYPSVSSYQGHADRGPVTSYSSPSPTHTPFLAPHRPSYTSTGRQNSLTSAPTSPTTLPTAAGSDPRARPSVDEVRMQFSAASPIHSRPFTSLKVTSPLSASVSYLSSVPTEAPPVSPGLGQVGAWALNEPGTMAGIEAKYPRGGSKTATAKTVHSSELTTADTEESYLEPPSRKQKPVKKQVLRAHSVKSEARWKERKEKQRENRFWL